MHTTMYEYETNVTNVASHHYNNKSNVIFILITNMRYFES